MKNTKIIALASAIVLTGLFGVTASMKSVKSIETSTTIDASSTAVDSSTVESSVVESKVESEAESEIKLYSDNLKDSIYSATTYSIANAKAAYNAKPQIVKIEATNIKYELVSLTCVKLTWDAEENREYKIDCNTNSKYIDNITFIKPENGICYINGLRTNSTYTFTITPITSNENEQAVSTSNVITTPKPEVIQEFEHEDGWTNCFAGEKASGLTAMPSSGAIYGSYCDNITGTGIRRFDNGDYACAMGTHYGYCNDRFLVELENGIQFTVRICDSKGGGDVQDEYGLGLYHYFGGSGKCIIEFIWDDGNLPGCVAFSGSWGGYNWNGLNLGANIKSIKKLANYDV